MFSARASMNGGGASPIRITGGLHDRFDEVGVLLGYAIHSGEDAQAVVSAGLAAVSGERVVTRPGQGTRTEEFDTRIGFPVQLALSSPAPGSGFGLVVHANLNREEVFGAVTVAYRIGFDGRRP